jgi:hypothetical protein
MNGGAATKGVSARVRVLLAQVSKSLDELKVFIPPAIQSIISKLALGSRGTGTTRRDLARAFSALLSRLTGPLCAVCSADGGLADH